MLKAIFLPTKPKKASKSIFFYFPEAIDKLLFHQLDA